GGSLTVATANAELGEDTAQLNPGVTPGRYALLSVADTGTGMTPEVLAQAFEPFFTTKEVGKGTGLGLATAYGVVKQSGGHVEVSSQVGRGTTVRVYLPRIEEPAPTAASGEADTLVEGRETVLVVEDEDTVRQILKLVLTRAGYVVLEASNGLEGLAVAAAHAGAIHLVLTDLVMPKLSGREMADRLVALRPGLKTLYLSGYTEDMVVHQGVGADAVNFLQKPFALAALAKKVRDILDGP
ncbi:MAG: response regulator, partial [Gemmataceae bacterium]